MSDISTLSSGILDDILAKSLYKDNETTTEKLQKIKEQTEKLPSVLDSSTLQKLIDGDYEISLREYTNLNTYKNAMNSMYGNNSADKFKNYLNNILQDDEDRIANAKAFIDKMKDNGMSNKSAVKLYSALKTYSILTSFKNYNFVNAKI